jgi:hypothetical protein
MTLTQYTIHHTRHLVPTLIASVVFHAFWLEFRRWQPWLPASLVHAAANIVLYVPLMNLALVMFGYWLHETGHAPFRVQVALVFLGVQLAQVYRAVFAWLVLSFVVLLWLTLAR